MGCCCSVLVCWLPHHSLPHRDIAHPDGQDLGTELYQCSRGGRVLAASAHGPILAGSCEAPHGWSYLSTTHAATRLAPL
jgi:hypothetical protein